MRIAIADGQQILREGLYELLSQHDDLQVVAITGTGEELLEIVREHRPELVLLDVLLPDLEGVEGVRRILGLHPACRVLALSARQDSRTVLEMLEGGASGFLAKSCGAAELVQALRAVESGQAWFSSGVARLVLDCQGKSAGEEGDSPLLDRLTPRERQVLSLVVEGMKSNEIGLRLQISPKTVDAHRHNLSRKLGVASVAALVKLAIREGLVQLALLASVLPAPGAELASFFRHPAPPCRVVVLETPADFKEILAGLRGGCRARILETRELAALGACSLENRSTFSPAAETIMAGWLDQVDSPAQAL